MSIGKKPRARSLSYAEGNGDRREVSRLKTVFCFIPLCLRPLGFTHSRPPAAPDTATCVIASSAFTNATFTSSHSLLRTASDTLDF